MAIQHGHKARKLAFSPSKSDEIITKRIQHPVALGGGLEKYGLQKVYSQFPNQCQELFVYDTSHLLSADKLLTIIRSSPSNSQERVTLDWFIEYLTLSEYSYSM